MKKDVDELEDELRPEYDFSAMGNGVRGKYVDRYRVGTNLVLLDPAAIVNSKILGAETLDTSFRSSSIDGP